MADVLFHEKIVKEDGDIIEMRIIRVPKSRTYPEGIRYALVYIHDTRRVVGYDNFEEKDHHKHIESVQTHYDFKDIDTLIKDFQEDVQKWKSKKSKSE